MLNHLFQTQNVPSIVHTADKVCSHLPRSYMFLKVVVLAAGVKDQCKLDHRVAFAESHISPHQQFYHQILQHVHSPSTGPSSPETLSFEQ